VAEDLYINEDLGGREKDRVNRERRQSEWRR
jgi:hypothetical protein